MYRGRIARACHTGIWCRVAGISGSVSQELYPVVYRAGTSAGGVDVTERSRVWRFKAFWDLLGLLNYTEVPVRISSSIMSKF